MSPHLAAPEAAFMIAAMGIACAAAKGSAAPSSAAAVRPAAHAAAAKDAARARAEEAPAVPPTLIARATLGALSASKWRLPSGLELVLLPDPTATSVCYMTWYRVGSRNEDEAAGETGLAHLFEHLMFTQTANEPEGEFDRTIEQVGGNANAMTYYDFTAYVDEVPPGELAVAVRLEADRMLNLDLRKRQVDNERDVVAEERLASVEDSVDGTLDELMYKQAFKTHPYHWPVIGWMKDIKAITRERAVAFYKRFYAPNNAVVVVAGRFEEQAALDLCARAYGGLAPSTTLPPDQARPERAPAAELRTTLVRPVPADRLVVGFRAPGLGDADRAAYDVTNEILTGGPSSRLYRRLVVDEALASSVEGDVAQTKDPGLYALWVQMTKGHVAEQAERRVLEAAADLAARPVSAAELGKAKARLETELWQKLGSSHGRAELLGQFEVAAGDFRRLFARAAEYAAVTAADVQRIAAGYLASGARSVVIARPGGGAQQKAGRPARKAGS
jgi:zinc protease